VAYPHVPYTFTDGLANDVNAARLNALGTGIRDAQQGPAVGVTHNAAQAITSGVVTVLAFNTERFDQAFGSAAAHHDTVTNNSRLTALFAGIYSITATVEWSADPANGTLRIRLNGTTFIGWTQTATGDPLVQNVERKWSMAVNDYVEVIVSQSSGSSKNINSTSSYSPEFTMVRIA